MSEIPLRKIIAVTIGNIADTANKSALKFLSEISSARELLQQLVPVSKNPSFKFIEVSVGFNVKTDLVPTAFKLLRL